MSNESDGQSPSGNIDAIKELLRKLEEVAVRDPSPAHTSVDGVADPATGAAVPGTAGPRDALLALNRGSSLKALGELSPARLIVIDTIPAIGPPASIAAPAEVAAKSSGRGIAIAAGSFVLGVAAAGALLIAYQPLSSLLRSPATPVPTTVALQSPPAAPAAVQSEAPRPAETPQAAAASPSTAASPSAAVAPAESSPALEPSRTAETTPSAASPTVSASSEPARSTPASDPPAISPPTPVQVRSATLQAAPPASDKAADVDWRIQLPDRIDMRSGERRTVDVRLSPAVSEASRLLVVLRNVPAWLSLSEGGAVGKEIWLLPAHQASDVVLEAAEGANGHTDLVVQLASIDGRILAERTIAVRATGLPASNAPMVASAPSGSDQMLLRLPASTEAEAPRRAAPQPQSGPRRIKPAAVASRLAAPKQQPVRAAAPKKARVDRGSASSGAKLVWPGDAPTRKR